MAVQQSRVTWPFRKDAEDSSLYAPFGRYGISYAVPDAYTQYRIQLPYTGAYFALMLMFSAVNTADTFCRHQSWARCEKQLSLILCLVVVLCNLFVVLRQSKGLSIASRRPSFLRACKIASQDMPVWLLWTVQVGAILIALLFVSGLHNHHKMSALVVASFAALSIATPSVLALLCIYILFLKQTHYVPARSI